MLRWTFAAVCCSTLTFTLSASAGVTLYDSNGFESPLFATGNPVGQDGWMRFGGSPSAYTVQTAEVASGTQAIQGKGGGLNSGSYIWPNLGFVPRAGEKVRIQVDIARTLSPSIADSSPVYAIDIYDFDFNRTSRFGLIYREDSGGIKAFVNVPFFNPDPEEPQTRPEFYDAPVAENTWVHFDVTLDYTAKLVSLTVDGELLDAAIPFNAPESTTLDSAELQIGTFNNVSSDNGYFDNYKISVVGLNATGDYNHNGVVDTADYTLWRDTLGSTSYLAADGNANGIVDAGDFDFWRSHFGQAVGSGGELNGGASVPEPSTFMTLVSALGALAATLRLDRGRRAVDFA